MVDLDELKAALALLPAEDNIKVVVFNNEREQPQWMCVFVDTHDAEKVREVLRAYGVFDGRWRWTGPMPSVTKGRSYFTIHPE